VSTKYGGRDSLHQNRGLVSQSGQYASRSVVDQCPILSLRNFTPLLLLQLE